jgi:transcription-repair coupling factor (superfamily II helicase)
VKNLSSLTGNRLHEIYGAQSQVSQADAALQAGAVVHLKGLWCSSAALAAAALVERRRGNHVFLLPDNDSAAFFQNDLANILGCERVFYFPSSYKRMTAQLQPHEGNIILRTRTLEALLTPSRADIIVVTHPHALAEKTASGDSLQRNTLQLRRGEKISIDFIRELLYEYHFTLCDFVYEPGQFSIRGSIVDIFSYSHHQPYRIDFFGDEVESIRSFDVDTQLSDARFDLIHIIPNLGAEKHRVGRSCFLRQFDDSAVFWSADLAQSLNEIARINAHPPASVLAGDEYVPFRADETFADESEILSQIQRFCRIEFGRSRYFEPTAELTFRTSPQPAFNKNFELLARNIAEHAERGYTVGLMSENQKQFDRLHKIFGGLTPKAEFVAVSNILHEGFIDHELKLCMYTDHQIFDRYRKYRTAYGLSPSKNLTLKEIQGLHPGDYIVHIDHGVGVFGGLEKMEFNGRSQECIRLVYRDNDVLYVNIHNLHKVSKFRGKDSEQPKLNKLGTAAWQSLKQQAKKKVKDIARDLIRLYAQRREQKGFAFAPDTYMQEELEASFIYEDTPDQLKATNAVKSGMESSMPMDHLVCGDVGFGKTEIAIRAAFKAASDSKQTAVLVPTTVLALQHEQTFKERLEKFPVTIDSVSRLKPAVQQRETFKKLAEGKVDIIIGTHKLLGREVKFKDLGLLIIDEEQKFGVKDKEKLKSLRVNVDTLTLTATPIPRTLQFSLMGVREMSIIATPPPNRHPIQTEINTFDRETVREAIEYEVSRGGQVFFIHNRVKSLHEMELLIRSVCPDVSTAVAHGQMEGEELEKIMLDFINGDFHVLVSTSIIESGLDIPNANTIIINQAQTFGLSDLHQLRGRVGRSNKKAFCYLFTPPVTDLTSEARRRLRAIEEFSDLGSGFNIALQDLDIRGAGNMMGAEQSGFIAEIGFETYHRILNEAMAELREEGVFSFQLPVFSSDEQPETQSQKPETKTRQLKTENWKPATDCQIDTDLELLFPESYIENVSERIRLYRVLDTIDDESGLTDFENELVDRFGTIPEPSRELINVIRLRQMAARLGFEKITLRNERMLVYFIGDQKSPYYESDTFRRILKYVQQNPRLFKMKEAKDKLAMSISPVKSIRQAMEIFEKL